MWLSYTKILAMLPLPLTVVSKDGDRTYLFAGLSLYFEHTYLLCCCNFRKIVYLIRKVQGTYF